MSKDLLKELVDFTSPECLNTMYKPVLVNGYGGLGTRPTDAVIVGDTLILDNEHIPLDSIERVEFGYYSDEHMDRLEKVEVDSVQEIKSFIENKRTYTEGFQYTPTSSYFLFYEVDKIGGGYAIIETTEGKYGIYYPTRKLTFEKQ